MTRYYNTFTRAYRDSASVLGYPYVPAERNDQPNAEGTKEVAAKTADAILAEVGEDPEMAAAALEAENARETPRKTLVAKLEAIAGNA